MKQRVVYLGPNYPWLHQLLAAEFPPDFEFIPQQAGDHAEQNRLVEDADFVVLLKADADLVSHMKRVKLIQYHGTGHHGKIDMDACRAAGIPVATAPGGNTVEVAEHTLMLILAVLRILPQVHNAVRRGEWPMWERRLSMHNLEGKSVGIVGFGRIGREVARRALAFDTCILYTDIQPADPETEARLQATYLPLDELLRRADVVVLNVPITPKTRGMITADRLRSMKPSSILINVARGEVVDEAALYTALRKGWISGAGLDVFSQEPISRGCPLLQLENVVLTPHVASGTKDSLQKKARAWAENFSLVMAGLTPNDLV